MKRLIEEELKSWKDDSFRLPLLVRGARQVGKTFIIEKFGREAFDSLVTVNFEFEAEFKGCFDSLDPVKIISKLEVTTQKSITPGKTLLFLDEIQECPRAILALRYFKEKMPELHVIGAGSLLEFALEDQKFSFPVGRVQFAYLKPLSFQEFLLASGEEKLIEFLSTATEVPAVIHDHALNLVRQYLLVGGMPAATKAFLAKHSYTACEKIQTALLKTHQNDFGKYAPHTHHPLLQQLFDKAPQLVGQHFQYVKVNREARSREIKRALDQLSHANLISRIYCSHANGLPLRAEINERKFKLLFLDVGLLQRTNQVESRLVWEEDLLLINNGQLAEQFVGQELQAYSSFYDERQLFFWERAKKGSEAEIDYVISMNSHIVPIEVKAGKTGRLRSLHQFLQEKGCPLGVRISQHPLKKEGNVLSVPLYMIHELPRLISNTAGSLRKT